MAVSEVTVRVRVLRARLFELGLYSSLLTTATMVAWWFWQRQAVGNALPGDMAPEMADSLPILTRLLLQKPIVLAFALAELILGLALLLAVVPMGWWLKSGQLEHPEVSPVTWLARSLSGTLSPAEEMPPAVPNAETAPALDNPVQLAAQPPGAGAVTPAQGGDAPAPASPGQPPQPQQPAANPAQPPAPAQNGTQPTPVQSGVPSPASQPPQPAQPPQSDQPAQSAQPPEMSPAQESSGLLQSLEIPPEEESLESLTDVSDILASFIDEDLVDPMLAELSASLEDVEIVALATSSRRLAHELHYARSRRPVAEPAKLVGEREHEAGVPVWSGR